MKIILLFFIGLLCAPTFAQVSDPATLQFLANFGGQYIVQQALVQGKLPDSNTNYSVSNFNGVPPQNANSSAYYFNETLYNAQNNITITTTFVINYQPANNNIQVISYSYNVSPYAVAPAASTAPSATNASSTPTTPASPSSPSQVGGYTAVSASDIQSNPTIQSLASYGAQYIVQQAIAAGKLPDTNANFAISSYNSVSQQVVNGINYQFNLTLYNSQNNLTLNTVFVIYYLASNNTRQIRSYSYSVAPYIAAPASSSTQPAYTPIATSDIQNSALLQSLATFGAQYIVQLAQSAGKLPNSNANFNNVIINGVSQQPSTGVNYRFNVTLINSDNSTTINANFVINYQAATNTRQVRSASYAIAPYLVPAQPANNTAPVPDFVAVPASEYSNSAPIQSLATFGAQYVIQQAIANGIISSNDNSFTISSFNEVSRRATNPINYRFNVNLSNPSNTTNLVAAYIVSYQPETDAKLVLSASYRLVPQNV